LSLELITGIENYRSRGERTVATIGTFDGVHLGHQAILSRLRSCAAKQNMHPLAITFEPHPRVLVTPDSPPLLLTCLNEKAKLFSEYLDGTLLVLAFDRQLMNLTAEEFIRKYLVDKIKLSKLIVGHDHAFGKGRSGTISDLMQLNQKYSFELEIVNPVMVDDQPISSSRIRRLIIDHKLDMAVGYLGHPYPLSGKVIKGIGLGRQIGFPTANIACSCRKLLPRDGVYSCHVEVIGRRFDGMMFIGTNHFNPGAGKSIEVNIFDFDAEVYGEELFCYPEVYVRESRVYSESSQLLEQLKVDRNNVLMLKK